MKKKPFFARAAKILPVFPGLLLGAFLLAGCQPEAVKPEPAKVVVKPDAPAYHLNLREAVAQVASSLAKQVGNHPLPPERGGKRLVVIDEFFNEQSAEVSVSGRGIQQMLNAELGGKLAQLSFSPLNSGNLQKSNWALVGVVRHQKAGESAKEGNWVRIRAAITDIKNGTIIAECETFVESRQFDATPTKFFRDAPMYLSDSLHANRVASAAGKNKNLEQYLESEAGLADAMHAYENGQFDEAEKHFQRVLDQSGGKNHLALSGLYQSQLRANRNGEAEKTFSKLVEAGLDKGSLSVKLLFKVRSTDFHADPELGSQYPMWLRQIALQLKNKKSCLDVIGHASKTGTAEYNERLSLQRAQRIAAVLQKNAGGLNGKIKAFGKGFQENIIGSGTDDAQDAIDRRVEFGVAQCG